MDDGHAGDAEHGDAADRARRTATDGTESDGVAETPIDAATVAQVADETGVSRERVADGLVVLNASLLGEHSTYEREREYATVEGVRAYVVDRAAWERLREEHGFDPGVADALRRAHTRYAEGLLERAAGDVAVGEGGAAVVVGIDTAEDMR